MGETALDLTFKLTGADQLINKMSKFADKLQEAAGRRAARKAMAIVRNAARNAVKAYDDPETPGSRIWKNVYLQQSRRGSKRIGGVYMRVGILGGANLRREAPSGTTPGGDTRHWSAAIELGTENIPARPFLRTAMQSNAENVAQTLVTELNREIDKIAAGK